MILIIGGAYQGKTAYARERFGLEDDNIFDLSTGQPVKPYLCFTRLECLTKAEYKKGSSAEEIAQMVRSFASDPILISREIGSGIVPMDRDSRAWREQHGKVLQLLAKEADSVIRIFCTIPEVLK